MNMNRSQAQLGNLPHEILDLIFHHAFPSTGEFDINRSRYNRSNYPSYTLLYDFLALSAVNSTFRHLLQEFLAKAPALIVRYSVANSWSLTLYDLITKYITTLKIDSPDFNSGRLLTPKFIQEAVERLPQLNAVILNWGQHTGHIICDYGPVVSQILEEEAASYLQRNIRTMLKINRYTDKWKRMLLNYGPVAPHMLRNGRSIEFVHQFTVMAGYTQDADLEIDHTRGCWYPPGHTRFQCLVKPVVESGVDLDLYTFDQVQ